MSKKCCAYCCCRRKWEEPKNNFECYRIWCGARVLLALNWQRSNWDLLLNVSNFVMKRCRRNYTEWTTLSHIKRNESKLMRRFNKISNAAWTLPKSIFKSIFSFAIEKKTNVLLTTHFSLLLLLFLLTVWNWWIEQFFSQWFHWYCDVCSALLDSF